ncbi:MAG: glycoside hydrolase family 3 protein [Alphaproteobacteria bacterium]|nr:glycoside hydrolase family 3 protein [Alphaproteobacteria bacterium]
MEKPVLAALLSINSYKLSDVEKYLFEKYNPLGVILFNRNIQSEKQTAQLVNSVKEVICRDDVLIAVDEEGGRVRRLKYDNSDELASQNILGQADNLQLTEIHSKIISEKMKNIGANMVFAPVLDIDYSNTTIALKNRCFGSNKEKIVTHGKIMCETYIHQGICPCIKHIPGHGRAFDDPHAKLPMINNPIKDLQADFYPFKQLKNMPAAMSAHILLKQIDDKNPVSVSKKIISEIIRNEIGFNGLLISDSIDMHALKGNIVQKALSVWNAGCDIVSYCRAAENEMIELCKSGKYMQDESLKRFEKIKSIICRKKETIVLDNQKKHYYSAISSFTEKTIIYDATEILHQLKKGEN